MCTAITYKTKDFYFGRNFDYEKSFGEGVTLMPRGFSYPGMEGAGYALLGTAHIASGVPLFFDAVNEKGLCIAALNFEGNASYGVGEERKVRLAVHELIPYVLKKAATVDEAVGLMNEICVTDATFSSEYKASQLHWMLADENRCVTAEPINGKIKIFENTVGVMTNNPPFDYQMFALNNYLALSPGEKECAFGTKLETYSRGMGAIGLPGDFSSQSRFVKAAFVKLNSRSESGETESVSQVLHILSSVAQVRGCVKVGQNEYEATLYSACINAGKGIYYYKTYNSIQVKKVEMYKDRIDGNSLSFYPME